MKDQHYVWYSVIEDIQKLNQLKNMLEQDIEQLKSVFQSVEVLGELTEKVIARVVAYGEKWMSHLVSFI